jgi:hypothetical protein
VGGVCQGRVITTVGGAEGASMTLSGTKLYVQLAGRIIVNGMNVFEGATDGSEPNGALIQALLANPGRRPVVVHHLELHHHQLLDHDRAPRDSAAGFG